MRIERIRIDGFGVFHDLASPDPLATGLSVILGDNEAGKSTLLAFLRAILFGFPDGRSSDNPYRPVAAVPHGGVLTLATQNGDRYVVERHRGQRGGRPSVTLPDGSAGADGTLERLLGFATRDLFRNIFAFSLTELQQFQSLSDEAVRATIYSAGVGTGRVSVSTMDRDLEAVQAGLFRPGGSNPAINRILKELDATRKGLRKAADDLGQFDALHSELALVEERIGGLRARKEAAASRHDRAERLLAAYPHWLAYKGAQADLAALPEVLTFPADGLTLLATVSQKVDGLAGRSAELLVELRAREDESAALAIDEPIEAQAGEIERLRRGRDRFDSAKQEHPAVVQQLENANDKLAALLQDLGPEWDTARVQAFNTSIAERELIRSHRDTLRETQVLLRDCDQRLDLANRTLQAAGEAEQQARQSLELLPAPAERDPGVLDVRRRGLRRLGAELREQGAHRQTVSQLVAREADCVSEQERLHRQLRQGAQSLPSWTVAGIVLIGVLVGAILSYQGNYLLGALVTAAIVLPGCAGSLVLRRALARQGETNRSQVADLLETVEQRLATISSQRVAAEGSAAVSDAQVRAACDHLGVAAAPDEKVIDGLVDETQAALETLREWGLRAIDLERAEERLKSARRDQEGAAAARERAADAWEACRSQWARWLSSSGLREDVTPDGALEIVGLIGQCREQSKVVAALGERVHQLQAQIEEYRRQVREVDEAVQIWGGESRHLLHRHARAGGHPCGPMDARLRGHDDLEPAQLLDSELLHVAMQSAAGLPRGDDLEMVLARLEERLRVAQGNRARRTALDERMAELRLQAALVEEQKRAAEQERDSLLSSGGALDAEDFRERAAVWVKRLEILRDAAQEMMALERIGGQGEHLELFVAELGGMDPSDQQISMEKAAAELLEVEGALDEAGDARGRLAQRIDSLAADDRCAALRADEQRLLTQLREAARSWAVHALARALLGEAKERYERERQPGVIRDAAHLFDHMTRGNYPRVLASPDEFSLEVLDAAGHRKQLGELSRGTQEQLYLAMRLGLIREFGRRQEILPVVMDDILVNFDPHRAAAALDVLLEIAQDHQLLLFTCHPETCSLVTSLSPATPIYRLAGGQLSLST